MSEEGADCTDYRMCHRAEVFQKKQGRTNRKSAQGDRGTREMCESELASFLCGRDCEKQMHDQQLKATRAHRR